jgi:hypothetical protein
MPVFADTEEAYKYLGSIFEEAFADPELGPKFAASGVILRFLYTEPRTELTADMPSGKVFYGPDGAPEPTVEMFMKADVAHRFWLGKVNVGMALAKGEMRAKGPIPKILKLVPLTKTLYPRYKAMLEADGRTDLLS